MVFLKVIEALKPEKKWLSCRDNLLEPFSGNHNEDVGTTGNQLLKPLATENYAYFAREMPFMS